MSLSGDESDADDKEYHRIEFTRNFFASPIPTCPSKSDLIGPNLFGINNKLAEISIPGNVNKRLIPNNLSHQTLMDLSSNFGMHAPALYQLIRLMKWELFLSHILSDYPRIESCIIGLLKNYFRLDIHYITAFLKINMVTTKNPRHKNSSNQRPPRADHSLKDSVNRMWTDYRNHQLLGWHTCLKHPTRQILHEALCDYYFSSSEGTCNKTGKIITMSTKVEPVLTMLAS
jgi:hypothetical protein